MQYVKLLPLLAAGITLLSGCNRGADVSENIPELPTSEAAYRSDSAEAAGDPAFPDSPAGLSPSDNISDTVPDTIPPTDDYGNVSPVRDQYDYLREMTDFPGQYYQLGDPGYECVTVPAEVSERYGNASIADGELLYFQNIEFDEMGYTVADLTVTEYNIITREAVSFELPTEWYALYIDRDYAVYYDPDGRIYRYGGWVDGYFELPYDYLYTPGTYMGYISPATAEALFGRRYEVGRVLPLRRCGKFF